MTGYEEDGGSDDGRVHDMWVPHAQCFLNGSASLHLPTGSVESSAPVPIHTREVAEASGRRYGPYGSSHEFSLFCWLPPELRWVIWEMSVHEMLRPTAHELCVRMSPRTLDGSGCPLIGIEGSYSGWGSRVVGLSLPVPAIGMTFQWHLRSWSGYMNRGVLNACRESRAIAVRAAELIIRSQDLRICSTRVTPHPGYSSAPVLYKCSVRACSTCVIPPSCVVGMLSHDVIILREFPVELCMADDELSVVQNVAIEFSHRWYDAATADWDAAVLSNMSRLSKLCAKIWLLCPTLEIRGDMHMVPTFGTNGVFGFADVTHCAGACNYRTIGHDSVSITREHPVHPVNFMERLCMASIYPPGMAPLRAHEVGILKQVGYAVTA